MNLMTPFRAVGRMFQLSGASTPTATPPGNDTASAGRMFTPDRLDELVSRGALPDPDTVLEKLGRTRADLRQMEGDDEVSQVIETRRDALVATPWRLEGGDQPVNDWLTEQVTPHIGALLGGTWGAVPYGYSVVRPVYMEPEPGAPAGAFIGGLAAVEELEFERFTHRGDGRWWRQDRGTNIPIVLEDWERDYLYFITVRRGTVRNPYGEALLSRTYWPWYFRHNGWRFWMQALERIGMPLLLGKTDGSTSDMADALAAAVQDAVIAVGNGDEVAAIQTQGNGEAFDKAEARLVQRMQKLFLGQTLTSSVDGKGSYAAANVHDRVRVDKRNADIRLCCPTAQRLVNALAVLRFGRGIEVPQFILDAGTGIQTERAERDSKLAGAGVVKFTERYLQRVYDYEQGDIEIPAAAPPGNAPLSRQAPYQAIHGMTLARKQGQRFTQDQQDVEALVGEALAQAASPISLDALRTAIVEATDPEDLAERLSQLYEGDEPGEFQELLERVLFSADVLGYVNAETARGV